MIKYKLKDLKEINPWGSGNKQMLHWFALTDSYYWFDFEGVEFPTYSSEIIKEWNQKNDSKYVDYQFARIFYDISDVLRHVEIPIPDEVFQIVNSVEKLEKFLESLKKWIEFSWDESNEQFDNVYEVAREWLSIRRLDFGYLTGGPNLFLLRNKDQLLICWIAKYKSDNGILIWDKPQGAFTCKYSEFIDEVVKSFKAFGLDMQRQIFLLLDNKPQNVLIDSDQIRANQAQYEELVLAIESKRLTYAEAPDWNNILNKMNEILSKTI